MVKIHIAKTAEPMEMPFGGLAFKYKERNHVCVY